MEIKMEKKKTNSIPSLCKKILKITDEEIDELAEVANQQLEYLSPLKMGTTAWQRNLGEYNLMVLSKVKELRNLIREGAVLKK